MVVSGFWGQNIGNAFFNLGGAELLRRSGAAVSFIQDAPAYATFRDESKGNHPFSFRILEAMDFDLLVLQGPLFTKNFANIWAEDLARLRSQGKDWAVLGGAFRSYSATERAIATEVCRRTPPRFIATRDLPTMEHLTTSSVPVFAGLDSGFFLPETYTPPRANRPWIAMAFDHFGEPRFIESPTGDYHVNGRRYMMERSPVRDWIASRTKAHAIALQSIDRRRSMPSALGDVPIVRPDHRTNPHLPFKVYRDRNGIASDEPWTYMTVYANSLLTVTDRVHACVATLAYGSDAMLFNPTTKRSSLLDAAGVKGIDQRPMRMSQDLRVTRLGQIVEFLEDHL